MLEELFDAESEQIRGMVNQLRMAAARLGLPFGNRTRTYNSRLAQELGAWAEEMGQGEKFHQAVFRAYFADGRNLADHEVLLDLARECGLSVTEATDVVVSGSHAAAVDEDWEAARQRQVTAVPTFILNKSTLVGAQPFRNLQGLMLQHGVLRR